MGGLQTLRTNPDFLGMGATYTGRYILGRLSYIPREHGHHEQTATRVDSTTDILLTCSTDNYLLMT